MIKWVKIILKFIFSRQSLLVLDAIFDIAFEIKKHEKSGLDNAALASIATYVRHRTKSIDDEKIKQITDSISDNVNKNLKDYKIGINPQGKVNLRSPIGTVSYDWTDGSVKWGRNIKI